MLICCLCAAPVLAAPVLAADDGEHVLKLPSLNAPREPMVEDNETAPEAPADAPSTPEKPTDAKPKAAEVMPDYNTIVLQGLNKVTAHISRLEAPLGNVMRFGNLEIIGRRCWKAAPEDQPENAALLEIWELRPGESPQRIFLGWMFSSSPGLSGLEHPVYDVTVLGCEAKPVVAPADPEKENGAPVQPVKPSKLK